VDRDPKNQAAWRQLGLRLARDGDPLAERYLREALALKPDDAEVATALGELLLSTGIYPEAFQILRAAVEHHPNFLPARMVLGRLYKRKGSYQHASTQFETITARDRQWPDAWYELAICYLQMQQTAKARSAITEALRRNPRDPQYLALQGSIEAAVGNVDAGIASTKAAAELAPRDLKIQSNLTNMLIYYHRNAQDRADAERLIARIEQLAPNHPLLPYQRGELERLRGNWQAAAHYLEMALRTVPERNEVYFSLSQAYRRLNRPQDAERMLAVYRQRQDLQRRIDEVRMMLGAHPNDVTLHARLADLQAKAGDYAGAVSTLEAALQIAPGAAQVQRRLQQLKSLRAPGSESGP
jgi:tetratricopeptide (TPR) repeat protein